MARLTRHELKQDEFRTTFEQFERLVKERYKEILAVAGLAAVIVGSTLGLKIYSERQEGAANSTCKPSRNPPGGTHASPSALQDSLHSRVKADRCEAH